MNRDTILSLGLLLTLSTQLRLSRLPVGPGEICLIIWLALIIARFNLFATEAFYRLLVFWVFFALAQSVGTINGVLLGDNSDTSLLLHDAMAYALGAAISCVMVSQSHAASHLDRAARMIVALGAILGCAQLFNAFIVDVPWFEPWYWYRFRGWSDNPNELGLLGAAVFFLSLHVAEVARGHRDGIVGIGCAALFAYIGWLTSSGTFRVAVMVGLPIMLVMKVAALARASGPRLSIQAGAILLAILTVPFLLASAAPMASLISLPGSALGKENGVDEAKTAALRLELWSQAVERSVEAGLLGLGPGPHLPVPTVAIDASDSQVADLGTPAPNEVSNFESHNTFLELCTQGGVLATLAWTCLMGAAIVSAVGAGRGALTALMSSLVIFAISHDVARSPIVWFSVALCLVAKGRTRAAVRPGAHASGRVNWSQH